jgi:hypothetical protein
MYGRARRTHERRLMDAARVIPFGPSWWQWLLLALACGLVWKGALDCWKKWHEWPFSVIELVFGSAAVVCTVMGIIELIKWLYLSSVPAKSF